MLQADSFKLVFFDSKVRFAHMFNVQSENYIRVGTVIFLTIEHKASKRPDFSLFFLVFFPRFWLWRKVDLFIDISI